MIVHEITLRFSVTPRSVRRALLAALLFGLPRVSATADLTNVSTLTAYYPSPAGYFETPANAADPALVVTGNAILGRDAGDVDFGEIGNPNTRLIVGKAPTTGLPSNAQLQIWGPPNQAQPDAGTLQIDGCIWLRNINLGGGAQMAQSAYRCRWSRPVTN